MTKRGWFENGVDLQFMVFNEEIMINLHEQVDLGGPYCQTKAHGKMCRQPKEGFFIQNHDIYGDVGYDEANQIFKGIIHQES